MSLRDPLLHPALIDPRQWGDVNLYEYAFDPDRSPVAGEEHQTPELRFRISHLSLDLRFDERAKSIGGMAVLTLSPVNDGLREIELDAAELEIEAITRQTSVPEGEPLQWETRRESITIRLDREYRRDEILTIGIRYSARPRKGLFFIAPDAAYPTKPTQIWSQGENEDAHWWFPCHDVTNQKMTTELRATVGAGLVAISNGMLIETTANPDETTTFHWRLDQPHPAYLVSVVIGNYEVIREQPGRVPLEYYLYPDRVEEGRRLFARTPEMIDFFAEKFGVDYPYPKYSQTLVDDFLFGAMENTSATTMTDRCLLDRRAEIDLNYDDIVAHELAHQWWGDLVTCKDWSQIWLNESFATYSEYLWREHTLGADEARWSLFQDYLVYLREDLTSHRRPMVCRKYRFSEELMDRHAYEKGACILHMLRSILGDEQFFRALAFYLKKHSFGVAETHDFKIAIEEATGRNLHWFFDQWIWNDGYPELEVTSNWDERQGLLRLTVRQLQAADEKGQIFRLPVELEVTDDRGSATSYHVEIVRAEQEFYIPCPTRPAMVLFDKGERIFKLLKFEKSLEALGYQLTRASELMDRVRAARELAGYQGAESIRLLSATIHGNDHAGVRMAAAVSLGEIGGEAAREILIAVAQSSVEPRVRRTCLWALGLNGEERNIPVLRGAIESDESYFAAVAAVRAIANIATTAPQSAAFDILSTTLDKSSWQEVVAASVFHGFSQGFSQGFRQGFSQAKTGAQTREWRVLDLALARSAYGFPLPIRLAAIGCLANLCRESGPERKSEAARIFSRLTELLDDPNHRARTAAVRALGKTGNPAALPRLRELAGRECLDMIRGALLDAIEKLEDNSK